jgi:hypothetical protein
MKKIEKKKITKYIGYFEIIGGILGAFVILYTYFSGEDLNTFGNLFLFLVFLMYSFVIVSGALILQENPLGVKLSIISQFLQIFIFKIATISYKFIAGMFLSLGFSGETVDFNFNLGSFTHLSLSEYNNETEFSINFVAVLLLYWLWKLDHNE